MGRNFILDKSGKIKLGVGLILISLILVTVLVGAFNVEEKYYLGDDLRIDLRGKGNYTARFFTPSKTLLKEGSNDLFLYELNELGKYEIRFKFEEGSENYSFEVVEKGAKEEGDLKKIGGDNEEEHSRDLDKNDSVENDSVKKENEYFGNEIEAWNEEKKEIRIGEPVKWNKKIIVYGKDKKIRVEVPYAVSNVSVNSNRTKIEIDSSVYNRVVAIVSESSATKEIVLENVSGNVELEYYTPAPEKKEREISKTKKEVVISAPDYLGYENVSAWTNVSEFAKSKEEFKVFWKEENRNLDFEVNDTNGNGLIDEIRWVVHHLSTQTLK
jgi:hypothetical protein